MILCVYRVQKLKYLCFPNITCHAAYASSFLLFFVILVFFLIPIFKPYCCAEFGYFTFISGCSVVVSAGFLKICNLVKLCIISAMQVFKKE